MCSYVTCGGMGGSSERKPPVEQPQRDARASGRVRGAPVREAGTG